MTIVLQPSHYPTCRSVDTVPYGKRLEQRHLASWRKWLHSASSIGERTS